MRNWAAPPNSYAAGRLITAEEDMLAMDELSRMAPDVASQLHKMAWPVSPATILPYVSRGMPIGLIVQRLREQDAAMSVEHRRTHGIPKASGKPAVVPKKSKLAEAKRERDRRKVRARMRRWK